MNLKSFLALLFSTIVGIIIFSTTAYTNNNGRAGNTGSPGETACNNCHNTNALNSGGGNVRISSPNMPNWTYLPGNTYTINVTVKKAGVAKFGFGFEALLPNGANGGLISTNSSSNAKTLNATVQGNSRTNAVHKQPNHFGTDSLVFSFQWTAPNAGTGNITFYAAGNASNSGNNSSGDFIYTSNQLITEASTTQIQQVYGNKELIVFPNPCNDYLKFSLPEGLEKSSTILQIFDINGKLVHDQNINGKVALLNISTSTLPMKEGIYFIHLQNGTWNHHEKIVVSQ
jgi:hypothetical protein